MKPIFLFPSLSIFIMCACTEEVCEPNTLTTTFSEGASIQMYYDTHREETVYRIVDGDELVFQHIYYKGNCESSAHNYYTKILAFELPADATELIAKDSALAEINCFIHHSSFWIDYDSPVTTGTLNGKKLSDDEWHVRGSVTYTLTPYVTFPQVETITIDRVFKQ